jgi:hypothetical protein
LPQQKQCIDSNVLSAKRALGKAKAREHIGNGDDEDDGRNAIMTIVAPSPSSRKVSIVGKAPPPVADGLWTNGHRFVGARTVPKTKQRRLRAESSLVLLCGDTDTFPRQNSSYTRFAGQS